MIELIAQQILQIDRSNENKAFFEVIFMTYSYVNRMINAEVFPNAIDLYILDLLLKLDSETV